MKRRRIYSQYHDRRKDGDRTTVLVPFDETLPPERRREVVLALSDLATRVATYIICRVIVDSQELLLDERLQTAHAILQRVTTTHLCNHKLTAEGLTLEFEGQQFQLHEEYKTMALTRTVYEHLAMFYFLYEHPKTEEERQQVWDDWQHDVQKIPYSQAWRYLFRNRDMARMYHHLSVHCHPVCEGLLQYQSQSDADEGDDCIPLHLSSCFLACLCCLFLRQMPQGDELVRQKFSRSELSPFFALARLPKEG
ncbi:MAG: hypothetical protein IJ144_03520 [Prevotella sp.]|nr:hypothetical protein [Prevotella sp.]